MIVVLIAHKAEAQCFFRKMTFTKGTFGYLSSEIRLVLTGNKDKLSRHVLPGIKKLKQDFKEIHLLNLGFAAVTERKLPLHAMVQVSDSFNETGDICLPLVPVRGDLLPADCVTVTDSRRTVINGRDDRPQVVDMELFFLADAARRLALPLSSVKIISDFYEQHVSARTLIEGAAPLSCRLFEIFKSFQESLNDLA